MKLIKLEGTVQLNLSTRQIEMSEGDEVDITDSEFEEVRLVVNQVGLICLTDAEAEARNFTSVLSDEFVGTDDEISNVHSEETLDNSSDMENIDVDLEDDSLLPVPENCSHSREELDAMVKSELLEMMDTIGIKEKTGNKKVLIERIIDHYRG